MDPLDIPYCTIRALAHLWPLPILFAFGWIVARRLKRRWLTLSGLAITFVVAALSENAVVTQWRLGLLYSEDVTSVDEAYAALSHSMTSAEAWQILKDKHENASIRFALAVMLSERGETALLKSVQVAPLEEPGFFGNDHLATLSSEYQYPLEVKELIDVAPGTWLTDDSFSDQRDDWPKLNATPLQ